MKEGIEQLKQLLGKPNVAISELEQKISELEQLAAAIDLAALALGKEFKNSLASLSSKLENESADKRQKIKTLLAEKEKNEQMLRMQYTEEAELRSREFREEISNLASELSAKEKDFRQKEAELEIRVLELSRLRLKEHNARQLWEKHRKEIHERLKIMLIHINNLLKEESAR